MGFPQHLDYLKGREITWFNPCWGYFGFWKRFFEFQNEFDIGVEEAWKHRAMKRNKEMYVSAIMALAMKQDTGEEWWFTKPAQDPPDALIGTIKSEEKTGGNLMSVRELEIVECLDGPLSETIQKKLLGKHKRYEPNTALVCLLSPSDIVGYDFRELVKELAAYNLPLDHIFCVFHGCLQSSLSPEMPINFVFEQLKNVVLIQLSPVYSEVIVAPSDVCGLFLGGEDKGWLRFEGRGTKGGFRDVSLIHPPELFD
ncbi:MAG: hypothetical protein HGB18_05625 [Candidatus Moranbacteria bacterium]|nr:hypothetical protein [Candidatus Moranbacteria bacterium]